MIFHGNKAIKEQRHKFLRGKIGNCFWVTKEEDASKYTEEEYRRVMENFINSCSGGQKCTA